MNKLEIKNSYVILHFDEYPILFIGKNYKSEIVIGSFIYENDEEDTIKYFQSIVTTSLAAKFLKGKLSYLELLKVASSIFIVTKDYKDKILKFEKKDFAQIDESYLPLPSAHCPAVDSKVIMRFEGLIEKSSLTFVNVSASKYTKNEKKALPSIGAFRPISDSLHKNYQYTHSIINEFNSNHSPNSFIPNSKFIRMNKLENKILSYV